MTILWVKDRVALSNLLRKENKKIYYLTSSETWPK